MDDKFEICSSPVSLQTMRAALDADHWFPPSAAAGLVSKLRKLMTTWGTSHTNLLFRKKTTTGKSRVVNLGGHRINTRWGLKWPFTHPELRREYRNGIRNVIFFHPHSRGWRTPGQVLQEITQKGVRVGVLCCVILLSFSLFCWGNAMAAGEATASIKHTCWNTCEGKSQRPVLSLHQRGGFDAAYLVCFHDVRWKNPFIMLVWLNRDF